MKYDLIIIGMGISGISAAIYAKNSGLNVLMLESGIPGGLLNKINKINNYPGHTEITGADLSFQLFESVNKLKIPYKKATVSKIEIEKKPKKVITDIGIFECNFIMIATGRKAKKLGLEHEEELVGKGISTCALCDGNLYKGKDIAVVGGGNSALEEALYLSNIVNKVYLIHRRDAFRAEEALIKEVKQKENIELLMNRQVTKLIVKEEKLDKIILNDKKELKISALFTYIGFEPNNEFIRDLEITNEEGYILVDSHYETKIKGIYAIGDCIKKDIYQLITAANDGVVGSIHIRKDIEKRNVQ